MNKKLIKLTESDLHRIVKQSVNKILRESHFDDMFNDAEIKFEQIKEIYQGNENELIGYLWHFIGGDKPNFIKYMETSGNLPDDF